MLRYVWGVAVQSQYAVPPRLRSFPRIIPLTPYNRACRYD